MQKRRIFIAINLPTKAKNTLIKHQRKWQDFFIQKGEEDILNGIRWTIKPNLHITLLFIGYVTDDETYEICEKVKEQAKKFNLFLINLNKIILGPPSRKPRMIWAQGEKSEKLAQLQSKIQTTIEGHENKIKPFKPHVTMARFKPFVLKKLPEIDEKTSIQIPVETIEIMQSNLKRTGAEYSVLESIQLGETL
ncbi:MAG: RNA 2',3'-cyclic phosphodiesterase [Candidatus Portnoybacteria bacterium]|nr:RNA 2',3'-cyclic phosphodiesterase [Candidatus Portnoybacteria bacterium]